MNRKKNIPATIALLMCVISLMTSCRKIVIDSREKELFLNCSEVGFYPLGTPRFTYSERMHQMCRNPKRGLFRIQTNIQDTCMNIILEYSPSNEGDLLIADLDYYDPEERITDRYQFECSKLFGTRIWLWENYTKTGIILTR